MLSKIDTQGGKKLPADRLKMDAITLVAASKTNDSALSQTVLERYENPADLTRAVADVAALLAGTGPARTAITGFLDYIGAAANGNGKGRNGG